MGEVAVVQWDEIPASRASLRGREKNKRKILYKNQIEKALLPKSQCNIHFNTLDPFLRQISALQSSFLKDV